MQYYGILKFPTLCKNIAHTLTTMRPHGSPWPAKWFSENEYFTRWCIVVRVAGTHMHTQEKVISFRFRGSFDLLIQKMEIHDLGQRFFLEQLGWKGPLHCFLLNHLGPPASNMLFDLVDIARGPSSSTTPQNPQILRFPISEPVTRGPSSWTKLVDPQTRLVNPAGGPRLQEICKKQAKLIMFWGHPWKSFQICRNPYNKWEIIKPKLQEILEAI